MIENTIYHYSCCNLLWSTEKEKDFCPLCNKDICPVKSKSINSISFDEAERIFLSSLKEKAKKYVHSFDS